MDRHYAVSVILVLLCVLAGCATVSKPPTPVEAPVTRLEQQEAQKALAVPQAKVLKRKVAVGRFSNETLYGKALLRPGERDPLGEQVSDMLSSRLVLSGKFVVLERPDLDKVQVEQMMFGNSGLVGTDVLIIGSVTEFGRSNAGRQGFLSSTKRQLARAKVDIRLVDVRTGHAFFSATGTGEATTESGRVAGFGSKADYDATLNDQVLGAAISDAMSAVVAKLEEKPWSTDILKISGNRVFISGGQHQGLTVGTELLVKREGEKVVSKQTGFEIALPGEEVAQIRVVSLFGDSEVTEGSVAEIVSGSLEGQEAGRLRVTEK